MKKYIKRIKKEIEYFTLTDWSVKNVSEFWDSVMDYDIINANTSAHNRRFKDSFPYLQFRNGDKILDFCCRTGDAVDYLSKEVSLSDKNIVCADISPMLLKCCAGRLKDKGGNIETVLVKGYKLPFDDNIFDKSFCFESIEHFSRPELIVAEMARVLRKGGNIIITTPNVLWELTHSLAAVLGWHHSEGPHAFLRRSRLLKILKAAKLKVLVEKTTVLLPCGKNRIADFFERFEKALPEKITRLFGLRRIFICEKE